MVILTKEDIRRWFRNGKSIKCGKIWYTIARTSHVKEGFALTTSEWEIKRGRKSHIKIVTYNEILDNVNKGKWSVQVRGVLVGRPNRLAEAIDTLLELSYFSARAGGMVKKPSYANNLKNRLKKRLRKKRLRRMKKKPRRILPQVRILR